MPSVSRSNFRFSTDILRRLGEELNPNPDQGIIELVKNSFDADAITCEIAIEDHPDGSQIVRVMDDGTGMNEDDVQDGWLVLGRSSKSHEKQSALGRRPSGNKGLGRLAALRLGSGAELITRPKGSRDEFRVDIDWEKFEGSQVVEDIPIEIQRRQRTPGKAPGSEIIIRGIRPGFDRMAVTRLARELLLLADPFADNPSGFQPKLIAKEFKDVERLVKQRYFDDAEFHLVAEVSSKGIAKAVAKDWKGKVVFEADHEKLRGSAEPYACPAAHFDLWIFSLNAETFATRKTTLGEVREWLKVVGGVHLYVRELRVMPYGEPGHDWLDMNLSRVRSPEMRPGTNTSVGRIRLDDAEDVLKQKTDRSGIIEGPAFAALRVFAKDALDWLARERVSLRDKGRRTERVEAAAEHKKREQKVTRAIERLPARQRKLVEETIKQYTKAHERDVRALKEEVQLYRTLGTAGIAAETFSHEASHPIKVIRDNATIIERTGKRELGDQYQGKLEKPVGRIKSAADSLDAFTHLTLNFVQRDKRRAGRVDVHEVINRLRDSFKPLLESRKTKLETDFEPRPPFILGSEAALESVLTNLVLNSLKALETGKQQERRILIRTRRSATRLELRVLDTGPGIRGLSVEDIWLPGQTTAPDGTGLGLTIVKDTVVDLEGQALAIAKGELGGAEFVLDFPVLEL